MVQSLHGHYGEFELIYQSEALIFIINNETT